MHRGFGLTFMVALAGACGVGFASEVAGTSHYFRNYQVTNSLLLQLETDGHYTLKNRWHDRIHNTDSGMWGQDKQGTFVLTSEQYKEAVVSPPFTLNRIMADNLDNVTSVGVALDALLAGMTGDSMAGGDVRSFIARHDARVNIKPEIDGKRLYSKDASPISRKEIEEFRKAIAAAERATTAVSITLSEDRVLDTSYLIIPATIQYPWAGLPGASVTPEMAEGAVKEAFSPERIRNLFVEIDGDSYEREATSMQQYLYVPAVVQDKFPGNSRSNSAGPGKDKGVDPASDSIGAIRAAVPDFKVFRTSTTKDIVGYYSNPGPRKRGLSGEKLYLFPDETYLYIEWADIMPGLICGRGTWRLDDGYVVLTEDGTLPTKGVRLKDRAMLPVQFSSRNEVITGLLGFPESFERIFAYGEVEAYKVGFATLEFNQTISAEDAESSKSELIRKHWRPDYAAGKPGAELPEW